MLHFVRRVVRRPSELRFHCTTAPPPSSNSKLFVGGLSWSVDEKSLKDAFSSFGEVTEENDDAFGTAGLVASQPTTIPLRGAASVLQFQALRQSTLIISRASWSVDEKSLKDAFSSFGEVTEVRIMYDKSSGRSRGFGFVDFSNDHEAKCAKEAMDGKALLGRPLRISIALEKVRGGPVVVPRLST